MSGKSSIASAIVAAAVLFAAPVLALAAPPNSATGNPAGMASAPDTRPGADQFASESQAKQSCGSDTVVWVNTRSHVYHFPGTAEYGHTKKGAFMCQAAADKSAFHAAKNEKQPLAPTKR